MNAPDQPCATLVPERPLEQAPQLPTLKDAPTEPDPLAQKWISRIERARKHWDKFHRRWRHNRALVSGYNKAADPATAAWNKHRANLIQGTITSVLPGIYARNPEISVTALHGAGGLKLFCRTLEKVTNRQLERAGLKERAKATVRAALTCSYGVVKVMYQRDMKEDPIIVGRINDTQDNIATVALFTPGP